MLVQVNIIKADPEFCLFVYPFNLFYFAFKFRFYRSVVDDLIFRQIVS